MVVPTILPLTVTRKLVLAAASLKVCFRSNSNQSESAAACAGKHIYTPDLLFRLLAHGSTVRIGRVQVEPVIASITIPLVELKVSGLLAATFSVIADCEPVITRSAFSPWPFVSK